MNTPQKACNGTKWLKWPTNLKLNGNIKLKFPHFFVRSKRKTQDTNLRGLAARVRKCMKQPCRKWSASSVWVYLYVNVCVPECVFYWPKQIKKSKREGSHETRTKKKLFKTLPCFVHLAAKSAIKTQPQQWKQIKTELHQRKNSSSNNNSNNCLAGAPATVNGL